MADTKVTVMERILTITVHLLNLAAVAMAVPMTIPILNLGYVPKFLFLPSLFLFSPWFGFRFVMFAKRMLDSVKDEVSPVISEFWANRAILANSLV